MEEYNLPSEYIGDKITKKHAVNTITREILRNCEKAEADSWDIKGYIRDYNYPQSIISEVFLITY